MVQTKVLTPDDWRVWRSLRLAALTEAPAAFGSVLADWQGDGDVEERWRHRLTVVAFNVMADVAGTPAGMVSGAWDAPDVELISLWVAPFARGRGVGDRLVATVVEWARSQHAPRVILSVKDDNVPAIRLYRRHGFHEAGPSEDSKPGSPETLFVRRL
ncbi:GNAT family N-acetyltransferase [Sulfobacillus harzensis]|uniref:GNAT family N-acetyltransferase n=1 Tax=Sulfobacillus harzensis TaxID=2729629 RepID=A0A7Y0L3W6_9FIRM|nr:GNAT family N-acetyltransferase [Sulfobacillus harzensis]NMP22823.1 GNAT family N-acetyltransferase [Sulfobacillus harzensis]